MPPKAKTVTDSELEIMKLLWKYGSLTAKEIRDRLYPGKTASDTATVQKLLQRLEKKEVVRRNRANFAHTFEALLSRNDLIGEELQSLAETMLEGSLVPVLTQLLKKQKLSEKDREQLRKIVNGG